VSLRWRIALGFALVALVTAAVIALATPPIVGQGFSELDNDTDGVPATGALATASLATPASGDESEAGDGAGAESTAVPVAQAITSGQAQQSTIFRLILAAIAAAAGASILGLLAAGRLVRPLTRLEQAATGLARGDLTRRSGLADRTDEFGQLGRTFDSMADELERSEESRRGFLQDAAHELKTPLAVIEATSSAILDGVYTPERRHLETIRDQSRILARIVDDLRTISLAEGGHLPLECRVVEVAPALASVAAGFEARAAAAKVTLTVSAPPLLAVQGDPDRIRQIAGALVDNALRHTPQGGSVALTAYPMAAGGAGPGAGTGLGAGRVQSPRTVRIAVDDSGTGIPPEALPHVFERFFQADPSHVRGTGTSGLGLSIVRALAEAQGGRAGAENRPGGGARLWFELPTSTGGAGPAA
jgi:two-component system, OmpR family, sensor histidine kinase BaeS